MTCTLVQAEASRKTILCANQVSVLCRMWRLLTCAIMEASWTTDSTGSVTIMVTPMNSDDMILMHQQMQKERIREAENWRLSRNAQSQPRHFPVLALLSWLRRLPVRAPRLQPQVTDVPVFTRRVRQQG
jgi:hypothetical protein